MAARYGLTSPSARRRSLLEYIYTQLTALHPHTLRGNGSFSCACQLKRFRSHFLQASSAVNKCDVTKVSTCQTWRSVNWRCAHAERDNDFADLDFAVRALDLYRPRARTEPCIASPCPLAALRRVATRRAAPRCDSLRRVVVPTNASDPPSW